jgi:hypothetical protein
MIVYLYFEDKKNIENCEKMYEKNNPTVFLPFLFIKYSKTTYQKHHLHVNIQKLEK